jgi:hypothetical protein
VGIKRLAILLLVGAASLSVASAGTVGTIDAGYINDTTVFNINADQGFAFDTVTIDALGISGSLASATANAGALGAVTAGNTLTYTFSDCCSGGLFSVDYDDFQGNFADINAYTVTVTGSFGSATGTFQNDLSGNDFLGQGNDNDFNPIHAADIVSSTPEPSTMALAGGALLAALAARRRRRA